MAFSAALSLFKGHREAALRPVSCLSVQIYSVGNARGQYAQSMQLNSRPRNKQAELHSRQSFKHVLLTAFSFLFLPLVCLTMNAYSNKPAQ